MIKNKIIYIFIFFTFFFLSLNKVNAYTYDYNITGQNPYYDITSFDIDNNVLTVSGWAYVNNKDNGKFSDGKVDFIPLYTIYIKDQNGNIAKDSNGNELKGSYYYGDSKGVPSNPFSVTCLKFTNNGGGANTAQDCMSSPTYNQRNSMIEAAKNQSPIINRYYDGVDFKISIDISGLQHDIEYHLELQMKIGNYYSNTVPLLVYSNRVSNEPEDTKVETKNLSDSVKIISEYAKFQQQFFSYAVANPIQDRCWFVQNATYKVKENGIKPELYASNNNATYYYYALEMKKGAYSGYCSEIENSLVYQNNPSNYTVWAHASWIQPAGKTGIIIERKNPCVYGTQTENAKEYAISHPGVCCDEIPETCCGNKVYIEKLYQQNPNHYIFSNNYCCSNEKQFNIDNDYYNKNDIFYTFNNYFPNNELESYKNLYWRQFDSTRFYSQNYINNICQKSEWAGVSCPAGTVRDESSTILSMQYINKNNIPNKLVHEVYMTLESNNAVINDIGAGYFSSNDFDAYLRTNKNSKFKEGEANNSLNNKHFKITVNSITKLGSILENGKYKYKVKFTIDITSTVGAQPSKDGNYYLPVKLWYCESKDASNTNKTCSNNSYFESHKNECCKKEPDREECSCETTTGEVCYTWSNVSDCTNSSADFANTSITSRIGTNGDETISEKITFNGYRQLDEMQDSPLKAGEGFDYEIDVTHTITVERNYYSDFITCEYSGCKSVEDRIVSDFFEEINRDTDDDIDSIENLIYKFDGKTSGEDYEIINAKLASNFPKVTKRKRIEICEYVYDGEEWDEDCEFYRYDSKKEYVYTYTLRLKQKYISKLHNLEENNIIEVSSPNNNPSNYSKDYLDGYNKFYTQLNTPNGIYPINIYLSEEDKGGITGKLTRNENFSCQYEIIGGVKTNQGDSGKNDEYYYFRPISLFSPFPNGRTIGKNWQKYCINGENCTYITNDENNITKQDFVYGDEPLYQVTLTSSLIEKIKGYNDEQHHNYGWDNMTTDVTNNTTSNFLNQGNTAVIDWEGNLKINTSRNVRVGDF